MTNSAFSNVIECYLLWEKLLLDSLSVQYMVVNKGFVL
jgi:hypothetical protein